MAVIIDGGGGDRKKPLHAELNLVPYIDLLTCMVAFLLITAVWTQLPRLEVQLMAAGRACSEALLDQMRIAVAVHGDGFNLIVKDDQKPIPLKPEGAGTSLDSRAARTRSRRSNAGFPTRSTSRSSPRTRSSSIRW